MISYADFAANFLDTVAFILATPWLIGRPEVLRIYDAVLKHIQLRAGFPKGIHYIFGGTIAGMIVTVLLIVAILFKTPVILSWLLVIIFWLVFVIFPFFLLMFFIFHIIVIRRSGFISGMAIMGAVCFFLARSIAMVKSLGFLA